MFLILKNYDQRYAQRERSKKNKEEENPTNMQSLTDLFGKYRLAVRYKENGKQKGSERGELITYFSEKLSRPEKLVAIRTAHYTLDELYALRSSFNERLRQNEETARKYWWFTTRTIVVEK